MVNDDKSNGYEEIAPIYIAGRGQSHGGIGAFEVADWSRSLPPGATVLDLGCGPGVPISEVLIEHGFNLYAVDASPRMVSAFQARFPTVPIECAAVEDSAFFNRTFDAVISWGLLFLLDEETQRKLIAKVAAVLPRGGRFLFTAPSQICTWADAMTDQVSVSLGHDAYQAALESNSFFLAGTSRSVGDNYYYFAIKT